MKAEELQAYRELVMGPLYGAGRIQCWICGYELLTGDRVLLVPIDCANAEKMHAGEPYDNVMAHYSCMERIP